MNVIIHYWFVRSNNWCLNIYILMNYHNGISAEGDLTNEDKERLVTWWFERWIDWVELVLTPYLNIRWSSHRFCNIDFKEVVIWNLIVRSDSCDWRCGRISRWAGFREKRRWSDEHLPVDGDRRSKLKSWRVHVKDRFQVAICEPVWVDDDGDIFGRQRINGTDRIFVRRILLASRSKHRSQALHGSSLA